MPIQSRLKKASYRSQSKPQFLTRKTSLYRSTYFPKRSCFKLVFTHFRDQLIQVRCLLTNFSFHALLTLCSRKMSIFQKENLHSGKKKEWQQKGRFYLALILPRWPPQNSITLCDPFLLFIWIWSFS